MGGVLCSPQLRLDPHSLSKSGYSPLDPALQISSFFVYFSSWGITEFDGDGRYQEVVQEVVKDCSALPGEYIRGWKHNQNKGLLRLAASCPATLTSLLSQY